jgi:sugar phosphate isomerase/epimerase
MNTPQFSRRKALAGTGFLLGAGLLADGFAQGASGQSSNQTSKGAPFRFCLNTATIRGHKLGIAKEIEVAGQAGYDAIEPWIDAIEAYVKQGGSLKDLSQRIKDAGLTMESAIGFPQWIVDDETGRAKGVEQAKREMDLVAQLGGKRFAAPPAGATDTPGLDWRNAVDRYLVLLQLGDKLGVIPQLELWGFSKNLNRLGECVAVAMETGHPKACVLADIFHLYKGGSNWHGIRLLSADAIQVLHMNDYPAEPPREKINDSYRVFPGDGTAPLTELLTALHNTGGQKILSLELFNRKYWEQDALTVAKEGLAKMKAVAATVRT